MSQIKQEGQRIDGVEHLLSRLKDHSELIARAYYQGSLVKEEENARGINILQQHKVLIPRGGQTYAISSRFREFLNFALNKERLYSINTDYGALFERLEKLLEDLQDAFREGRVSDRDGYEEDVSSAVDELSDTLSGDLSQLRLLVENHFGTARTLSEKRRQNEYYIHRTEMAVKAIRLFGQSEWMEYGGIVQTDAAFVGVSTLFRERLQDKLPGFRQHLDDILVILNQYLFEYRKIEARTSRLRKAWNYLEHHPDHAFQDYSEGPMPPLWLWKCTGIAVRGYPDVYADYEDTLAEMAARITPRKTGVSVPTKRRRGTMINSEPIPDIPLEKKPYQIAMDQMVLVCTESRQSLSARQWYQDHPEEMQHAGNVATWLQSVLESLDHQNVLYPGVSVQRIETPIPGWTGNVLVEDVEVLPWTRN